MIFNLIKLDKINDIKKLLTSNRSDFLTFHNEHETALSLSYNLDRENIFRLFIDYNLFTYDKSIIKHIILDKQNDISYKIKYLDIIFNTNKLDRKSDILQLIIEENQEELFNYFLGKGANRKPNGTPLFWVALRMENFDMMKFILDNPSSPIKYNREITLCNGNRTIWEDVFLFNNNINTILTKLSFLLNRNVDINFKNPDTGENILIFIIQSIFPSRLKEFIPVFNLLVENGIDINSKNLNNASPLDILESKKDYFDNEFDYIVVKSIFE
jgi:hypothetical protein